MWCVMVAVWLVYDVFFSENGARSAEEIGVPRGHRIFAQRVLCVMKGLAPQGMEILAGWQL